MTGSRLVSVGIQDRVEVCCTEPGNPPRVFRFSKRRRRLIRHNVRDNVMRDITVHPDFDIPTSQFFITFFVGYRTGVKRMDWYCRERICLTTVNTSKERIPGLL